MQNFLMKTSAAIAVAAALAACGGGGGDSSNPGSTGATDRVVVTGLQTVESFDANPAAKISATGKAITGSLDRSASRWTIAPGGTLSSADVELSNADCADASYSSTNNNTTGTNFRTEESVSCTLSVSVPALNSATPRTLNLTFTAADAQGNSTTSPFTLRVVPAPGRDFIANIVQITPQTTAGSTVSGSSITTSPGQTVTLQASARGQVADIDSIQFQQVAGDDVILSNEDCAFKTTNNGQVVCAATFAAPTSPTTKRYAFQALATDRRGNSAAIGFNVTAAISGSDSLAATVSNAGTTLANPIPLRPGQVDVGYTCAASAGSGGYAYDWSVRGLTATGAADAETQFINLEKTGDAISFTTPSAGGDTVYALLCTVTDSAGTKFPVSTPTYTPNTPHPSTVFFKVVRESNLGLELVSPVQQSTFVGDTVTVEARPVNLDGSAANVSSFNYRWVATQAGAPASNVTIFSPTSQLTGFSASTAGTYTLTLCARRAADGVPSSTCAAEAVKISSEIQVSAVTAPIANASFVDSTPLFRVIGEPFTVTAEGSRSSNGAPIFYLWRAANANATDISIVNSREETAIVTPSSNADNGEIVLLDLFVSTTESDLANPSMISPSVPRDTLEFRVSNSPNGPASIATNAGANQSLAYSTWSNNPVATLSGSAAATNAGSFPTAFQWGSIASAGGFTCDKASGLTISQPGVVPNPNPANQRNTSVDLSSLLTGGANEIPAGGSRTLFFVLAGRLVDGASTAAIDCQVTTVQVAGPAPDITVTASAAMTSIPGVTGQTVYNTSVSAVGVDNSGQPGALLYAWFLEDGQGSINNASEATTGVSITSGPSSFVTFSVIAYKASQLSGDFATLNLQNEANRATFTGRYPAQKASVTIAVTEAP